MKLWLLIITLTILTACKTAETLRRAEIVQSEKPLTIGDDKQFLSESLPSEIKVRVAISRSEDLRVSVGQKIKTGDVIADREKRKRKFNDAETASDFSTRKNEKTDVVKE